MCCQENRSQANIATTFSEPKAVAADTAVNDKHFNSFLIADEAGKIAVGYRARQDHKSGRYGIGGKFKTMNFQVTQYPVICFPVPV